MTFNIITIFPNIFDSYFNESIIKRAREKSVIKIEVHNLRDWTTDRHQTVDDTPYGGGAGMVMKIEPIYKAVCSILYSVYSIKSGKKNLVKISSHDGKSKSPYSEYKILNTKYNIPNTKIILLSAKGKTWNQQLAKKYTKLDNIIMICGRYEGVDERITKFIDEEISIGDYVLTGGEIGAMTIVDSITRLLPGVLGNPESIVNESHTVPGQLEYPQYTRPEVFEADGKKYKVPKQLLSGNHKDIAAWREQKKKHR